ncbi:MAG: DUF885 domain-containing protein [Alphaproteobacteria bacterium]|nr:MAG: DUF885 domain-containing protein [Alphaproteobacteria bacterium]
MRTLLTFVLIVIGLGSAHAGPADDLHRLFAEEWQWRMASDPLAATMRGIHDHDDRLPDVSPAAQAVRLKALEAYRARLEAIPRAVLDEADRLNADLFAFDLDGRIAEARFRTWRIPFLSDSGFHTEPVFVIEAMRFRDAADYDVYLKRLAALPRYLEQNMANMRLGMREGFTMPRVILDGVAPGFAALAGAEPEESPFFKPFRNMPETIPEAERSRILGEARRLLAKKVLPAYARLHRFFTDDYMPAARTSIGARDLPDGAAFYRMRIRRFTTLDLSAEEIHKIGLAEVERIRTEMQAVMEKAGFKGKLADFIAFLRRDPRFYAKTPQELLRRAAWIAKTIDGKLPAYFGRLPRMPYGVRAVPPEIAPNYTTGRYWPAIPGVRGGLYMVNTYALDKRPLYALPALTLHEAVPGHHLQVALANEIEGVPEFRKALYVVAFGEGWGLYSERLGEEMGIYETPYEEFGRLSYEMWRAVRLVVDTGIHAMGWTRDEAIAFLRDNTALSEHNVATEIDRYISWPGQALGYKIGEIRIRELRAKAEAALGDRFDIRAFHDAVLENGSLPLPILERRIDAYIARAAGREAP